MESAQLVFQGLTCQAVLTVVKGSHHTPCTPEELTFWDNGKGQRSSRWSRADGSCSDIHTHA